MEPPADASPEANPGGEERGLQHDSHRSRPLRPVAGPVLEPDLPYTPPRWRRNAEPTAVSCEDAFVWHVGEEHPVSRAHVLPAEPPGARAPAHGAAKHPASASPRSRHSLAPMGVAWCGPPLRRCSGVPLRARTGDPRFQAVRAKILPLLIGGRAAGEVNLAQDGTVGCLHVAQFYSYCTRLSAAWRDTIIMRSSSLGETGGVRRLRPPADAA